MKKIDVFLGGTCGENRWRNDFMPKLDAVGITYFNPVVDVWNRAAQIIEDEAKQSARWNLFYLGNPLCGDNSISPYSIFEAATVPRNNLIVVVSLHEFTNPATRKSMSKIAHDLENAGVIVTQWLRDAMDYMVVMKRIENEELC